jgi:hypothetical protein
LRRSFRAKLWVQSGGGISSHGGDKTSDMEVVLAKPLKPSKKFSVKLVKA